MTTKKIYGPWIEWHGGECPVPPETLVEVRYRNGDTEKGNSADEYLWYHGFGETEIVEYRAAVEQADLDAADRLLRANGYTVTKPLTLLTFEDVVPMTKRPAIGVKCWAIGPTHENGAYEFVWFGSESDQLVLKRRMAYLDKEHALIAARHIFGLKGGEL